MRHIVRLLVPAVAASVLLAACGSSGSGSGSSTSAKPAASGSAALVRTASDTTIGSSVLVDRSGKTLYSLSAERNGRFICTTSACLGVWHPLTVVTGATPSGAVGSLGTVKRPDGTLQVTFRGEPLYTFAQDAKAGDTKGQGVMDVGTWSVVKASGAARPATTPSTSGRGGSYGY
jgi:predicted lipoprotein with Yx(FWY)xxD motif